MATQRINLTFERRLIRSLAHICIVAGLAIGFPGCSKTPSIPQEQVKPVSPTPPLSEAERQRRSDTIRGYFRERATQKALVATTRTKSGQIIDWIRPESQIPPDQKLAVAPLLAQVRTPTGYQTKISRFEQAPTGVEQLAKTEVQDQPEARGPKGTVPVVRFDVETYLKTERDLPENPADVLKKIPPPAPDSNNRYYGLWQRFDTFFGTSGRINIWDTAGPNSGETSIAQTAVIRGNPMQAIEAGKIESNSLNGDDRPHFFTYYRTDGTASGDWVGGYNTLVKGWIQVSPSVAPGMSLVNWNSTVDGNQYSLDLEVRLWNGNWLSEE